MLCCWPPSPYRRRQWPAIVVRIRPSAPCSVQSLATRSAAPTLRSSRPWRWGRASSPAIPPACWRRRRCRALLLPDGAVRAVLPFAQDAGVALAAVAYDGEGPLAVMAGAAGLRQVGRMDARLRVRGRQVAVRGVRFENPHLRAPVVDVVVLPGSRIHPQHGLEGALPPGRGGGQADLVEGCRDGLVIAVDRGVVDAIARTHDACQAVTTPRGKYRRATASLATEQALCTRSITW